MKKNYVSPVIETLQTLGDMMLASSVTGNNGTGYGGIDTEGEKDPSVKENPFGDSIFE
jgi:hypothetical protein